MYTFNMTKKDKKMTNSTKGKKGFQNVKEPRNIIKVIRLTEKENKILKHHLKNSNKSFSKIVRERLKDLLKQIKM